MKFAIVRNVRIPGAGHAVKRGGPWYVCQSCACGGREVSLLGRWGEAAFSQLPPGLRPWLLCVRQRLQNLLSTAKYAAYASALTPPAGAFVRTISVHRCPLGDPGRRPVQVHLHAGCLATR